QAMGPDAKRPRVALRAETLCASRDRTSLAPLPPAALAGRPASGLPVVHCCATRFVLRFRLAPSASLSPGVLGTGRGSLYGSGLGNGRGQTCGFPMNLVGFREPPSGGEQAGVPVGCSTHMLLNSPFLNLRSANA